MGFTARGCYVQRNETTHTVQDHPTTEGVIEDKQIQVNYLCSMVAAVREHQSAIILGPLLIKNIYYFYA